MRRLRDTSSSDISSFHFHPWLFIPWLFHPQIFHPQHFHPRIFILALSSLHFLPCTFILELSSSHFHPRTFILALSSLHFHTNKNSLENIRRKSAISKDPDVRTQVPGRKYGDECPCVDKVDARLIHRQSFPMIHHNLDAMYGTEKL